MKSTGIKDVMSKTKSVAAATTLVAGLGLATNVHAEEVIDNTQDVAQATTETAEVTQSDVNTAKATLDKANQAVSEQEQVAKEAATNADSAQEAYDQAKENTSDAQDVADKATPEAIKDATADVTTAQNQVSTAENVQEQAETTQSTAETAVANQSQTVSQAQDQVTSSQAAVDAAQKDVTDKQAILDGTGQAQVIANRDKAQEAVNTAQSQVSQAETDLAKAKEADANREQAIAEGQKDVDATSKNVSTAKADLEAKTATANQAQADLLKAQEAYTTAENDYKSINTIQLSQAYIDALKVYADGKATAEQKAKANETLKAESAKLAKLNVFKSNPNEPDYKWGTTEKTYDAENLPDEVVTELSLFGSDLINQIRTAFGTPQTVVTASSVELAQRVRKGYQSDKWGGLNMGAGHDVAALNKASASFNSLLLSEDLVPDGKRGETTIGSLKRSVYHSTILFLFGADEWMHASSVAGLLDDLNYFGYAVGYGDHFLFAGSVDKQYFNTTPISNLYSSDKVIATYNIAKADLEAKTTTNNSAQSALGTAQNSYTNAVVANTKARQELDEAQSVTVQTPTAQSNLSAAQVTLKQAQENLVSAQKAVDALNADIKVKEANLAKAKQVLTSKEAELTAKQDTLTKAKARLASLQADLTKATANVTTAKANADKAKATLSEAQTTLAKLKAAPQLLKEAQSKEAMAKANLLKALDTLEDKLVTLKGLQEKQAVAQVAYDTTSKAYQDVLDKQAKAHLQAEYDSLVAQGKQPIPVMDETGNITGYTVLDNANQGSTVEAGKQTATVTPTATKASTPVASSITKQTANSLPMTGDATSTVAILFGTVLTLFGLVGVRRKQDNN